MATLRLLRLPWLMLLQTMFLLEPLSLSLPLLCHALLRDDVGEEENVIPLEVMRLVTSTQFWLVERHLEQVYTSPRIYSSFPCTNFLVIYDSSNYFLVKSSSCLGYRENRSYKPNLYTPSGFHFIRPALRHVLDVVTSIFCIGRGNWKRPTILHMHLSLYFMFIFSSWVCWPRRCAALIFSFLLLLYI
jgi:hypothetical protein